MNVLQKRNSAITEIDHSSVSEEMFRESNGAPALSLIDIPERRAQISESALKELMNLSTDIITVLNEDGTILFESPSIERILGYERNELNGLNAFSFVHKDDVAAVMDAFADGINSPGKAIFAPFRFRHANGNYVYLEAAGTKFTEKPGSTHIVVNSRDITKRVEDEIKLNRLTAAVEQSSNTIVITDIDGHIQYVNKKFEELTGYSKDEVIGGKPNLLKSGETSEEVYKDLWTTILTGRVWEGEFRNLKKSGEMYWERIKITPVVDSNDRITNFIAMKDDISLEKEKDSRLEHSLREKEMMLKEIHHRVKNNLQIVI
ncbi:MAG: PAS domain S-box protein, partial [Ignavibacteria bacterium]|nr:PAS domain S-box protein [Ignavibacteria bacterium]